MRWLLDFISNRMLLLKSKRWIKEEKKNRESGNIPQKKAEENEVVMERGGWTNGCDDRLLDVEMACGTLSFSGLVDTQIIHDFEVENATWSAIFWTKLALSWQREHFSYLLLSG